MNTNDFRNDVILVLRARGIRAHRLAAMTGVDKGSLWRFLNKNANVSIDTLSRLWKFIYGDQRPKPILSAPPKESREPDGSKCVHCPVCEAQDCGAAPEAGN